MRGDGLGAGADGVSERAMDEALRDLGRSLDYPPTPRLTSTVVAALGRERRAVGGSPAVAARQGAGQAARWAAAVVAVAAVVGVALVLGMVPGARRAIADRLGLPAITVRLVEEVPRPPSASPVGDGLFLGTLVDLATARERFGSGLAVPDGAGGLGEPDGIYVSNDAVSPWVSFVYRSRPGLPEGELPGIGAIVSQVRGVPAWGMVGKGVGPGARVEALTVAGGEGIWVSGERHAVSRAYEVAGGRLAGNVLAWQRGDVTFRLEAEIDRAAALAVAESLREV